MPLHPQAQRYLDDLAAANGKPWHEIPVEESRELFNSLDVVFGQGPELPSIEDQVILERIPIRIYRPSDDPSLPVIVYFHGGGWVVGNIQTHDAVCRNLSRATKCAVVSVDYRLAPEHKYPAAFADAFAATVYVSEHAKELRVDAERLIVAGDSAGGNLAAAVALKSRDQGRPQIEKQILIYPVIEPNFDTNSYLAFAENYGLTRVTMEWFWQQYLNPAGNDGRYVRLANIDAEGLPPAFILTAEYDVLRDEGEHFACRLEEAGVSVRQKRYEGVLHGFVHFAGVFDDAHTAHRDIADFVKND